MNLANKFLKALIAMKKQAITFFENEDFDQNIGVKIRTKTPHGYDVMFSYILIEIITPKSPYLIMPIFVQVVFRAFCK